MKHNGTLLGFALSLYLPQLLCAQAPVPVTADPWKKGDMERPRPAVIVPPTASTPERHGLPPSDAVVLFDGKDLSHWRMSTPSEGGDDTAKWKVENGYFEIVPKTGTLQTRDKFGDCQIHFEWATPEVVTGKGQGRGNSGFFIQGHPEIQVLDSYENDTYPDGQAAALYSLLPPLVNACRKPGEWQTYDIVYIAPKIDGGKVVYPALFTVFHNGVLVHHAVPVPGSAVETTFALQDHGNPVRYRNFWVRKLRGYDQPAATAAP